jgi:hypothetical protein
MDTKILENEIKTLKKENCDLKRKFLKKQFDAEMIGVWWKSYYENKIKNENNTNEKGIYIVYVVGKTTPTTFHDTLGLAELEAKRLVKKEKTETFVFKAVLKFELTEVTKTDLTK